MDLGNTQKLIEEFSRNQLKKLLSNCTEEQKEMFIKLYGNVDNIRKENIKNAIDICERTIIKNEKFDRK